MSVRWRFKASAGMLLRSVTTNAFTTATISGLGPTSFSRGAAAPNTLGVVSIGGGPVAAASLVKTGAGRLVLSCSNSFTAGTTVSGGAVQIESESALGGSAATFAGIRLVVGSAVGTIATPARASTRRSRSGSVVWTHRGS